MRKFLSYILTSILCVATMFSTLIVGTSFADTTQYSKVLTDLQEDSNFNVEDFSTTADSVVLQIITVAESEDDELFIYTYEPTYVDANGNSIRVTASTININVEQDDSKYSPRNYTLTLLNSEGVFSKYLVRNLEVDSTMTTRLYEVVSIYRSTNEHLPNGNTITERAYHVGRQFIFTTTTDENNVKTTTLTTKSVETIDITSKYVGFVRYLGNLNFWGTEWKGDCHFVAFSTNSPIDKICEADVCFLSNDIHYQRNGEQLTIKGNDSSTTTVRVEYPGLYDENVYDKTASLEYKPVSHVVTLTDNATGSYQGQLGTYFFDRIQTVDDFLEKEHFHNIYDNNFIKIDIDYELSEDSINNLSTKDWVLRFYESDYTEYPGWYGGSFDSTIVYDVSILRLKFVYDGDVYNLGVVDDKQVSSGIPDNSYKVHISLSDKFWDILKLILLILGLILLVYVISKIVTFFFKINGNSKKKSRSRKKSNYNSSRTSGKTARKSSSATANSSVNVRYNRDGSVNLKFNNKNE